MIIAKLSFRNLFRHKRRSFFTGLTILGGFALSCLSIGIAEGSYDAIIKAFTQSSTGDIQLHKQGYLDKPSVYKTIDNPEKIETQLLNMPQIASAAPRVYFPALIFAKDKTTATQIMAIDPVKESKTTTIEHQIEKGTFLTDTPSDEIMLGHTIAKILNVTAGAQVSLVSQSYDGSIANDNFKVTAVLSQNSEYKRTSIMHIKTAQEFFYLGNRIHEIAVILKPKTNERKTATSINQKIKDKSAVALPWQKVKKDFYRAMKADKKGNNISILVVMIIVAIGVLNTVLMSVLERTREFGVLKALGTKPSYIFTLIILETSFLTFISIAAGMVLALGLNYYFTAYGIKMPEPVTYGGVVFDKIISTLKFKVFYIPVVITFITAVTVSIFPAFRAAKVTPVKAMRDF
jgi:ABC-type lipoprotein release transport system permease subunit